MTPSPTFPAAAMPPLIEETGRERYLQNPWRGGIPVAWRMHLGVTHGGRKGRGRGIYPFPDISRRGHMAPRRRNRQGRYLQNPWRGGIPVAWQMHLGVTHGGRKGQGRGIGPLTWASRHRRGGLPNKVIGGRPPSHGAGGHLMHGARGAEKGAEGQRARRGAAAPLPVGGCRGQTALYSSSTEPRAFRVDWAESR